MNQTHTKILSYTAAVFFGILSLVAIVGTTSLTRLQQSSNQRTITVNGQADISATPDIASFSFSVSELADDPQEAQEIISEKISSILSGLSDLKIKEKDIKTDSYSINPKYQWVKTQRQQEVSPGGIIYYPGNDNQQVLVGYDVRQNVSVKVRDLEQAPDVLTLLAQQSVDNLYGPNFEIENPEDLKEKVRKEAIEIAQKKAKRLAKDLDVSLGTVVSFSDNNGGYYPQPYYARSAMDMGVMEEASFKPELPTGQQELSSSVTITYTIR